MTEEHQTDREINHPTVSPDTTIPDGNPNQISKEPSAWRGFWLVVLGHLITGLLMIAIAKSEAWLPILMLMPLLQLIYVVPMLIIYSGRKQKRVVHGILIAMCITLLPLALAMLFALAGLGLCAVILAGSALVNH